MGESRGAYSFVVGKREGKIRAYMEGQYWNGSSTNRMDSISVAQNGDCWRAVVNAVMNPRFCTMQGIPSLAEELRFSINILLRKVSPPGFRDLFASQLARNLWVM